MTLTNARTIINGLGDADKDSQYDIHFSSIGRYLDSVFKEAKEQQTSFNVAEKDFWKFNHSGIPNAYWSGYYSSYPLIKHEIMQYSDFVQSAT